jgi:hypothetical protein
MTTLQRVLQEASKLTINEKRSLAQFLLEQAAQDARTEQPITASATGQQARPDMERAREFKWLKENWREYLGQWVCLEGDKLISSGINGHQVHAAAKAAGIQVPFIVRVEDPTLPYAGGMQAL